MTEAHLAGELLKDQDEVATMDYERRVSPNNSDQNRWHDVQRTASRRREDLIRAELANRRVQVAAVAA